MREPLRVSGRAPVPAFRWLCFSAMLFMLLPIQPARAGDPVPRAIRQRLNAWESGYDIAAAGAPLYTGSDLAAFYAQRSYTPAWGDQRDREQLLRAVDQVSRDGLNPGDYHRGRLEKLVPAGAVRHEATEERADRDLLFSDAFLLLARHLSHGRVGNPAAGSAAPGPDVVPTLVRALRTHRVAAELDDLKPHQPGYVRLKQERRQVQALVNDDWDAIPDGPPIKPGTDDVRLLPVRQHLELLGDLQPGMSNGQGIHYDPDLQQAVAGFQARHGLDADGVINQATLNALNVTPKQILARIDLNLERWRWSPTATGGRHLTINMAASQLRLMDGNSLVDEQKLALGRTCRRAPAFSASMRYVVFNPYWNVPHALLTEQDLGELRRPGFLKGAGILAYRGWGSQRKPVASASADPSYHLVQKPGPSNALGRVEFLFPNPWGVSLHGTPAKDVFPQKDGTFVDGCIRVEQPADLASALLANNQGWNRSGIDSTLQSGTTVTVPLRQTVPVQVEYRTTWVDEHGTLQIRSDVLGRDKTLSAAMSAPLKPDRVKTTGK